MGEQKLNHGQFIREDGFYRVLYQGNWIIAQWEATAYGVGYWLLPGCRDEKRDCEMSRVDETSINQFPKNIRP